MPAPPTEFHGADDQVQWAIITHDYEPGVIFRFVARTADGSKDALFIGQAVGDGSVLVDARLSVDQACLLSAVLDEQLDKLASASTEHT